ncbi:hypothetical protein ACK1KB_12830 [Chryseobacterium sp. TY3]
MEKIYLEKEFGQFCKRNGISNKNNVSDYINYVQNSNKILDGILFQQISAVINSENYEELENIKEQGTLKIIESNQKSKAKYKSGFIKYIEFVSQKMQSNIDSKNDFDIDTNHNLEELDYLEISPSYNPLYLADSRQKEYSISDIKQIFFFRLITQNRFNKCGVYFPISFLKQYFYKTKNKDYFNKIILNQIDNISFLKASENDLFYIKNCKKLAVNQDGSVTIDNEKIYSLDFVGKKNVEMSVKNFSEIVIDHKRPMNDILLEIKNSEINEFGELTKINLALRKKLWSPVTYKKLIKNGTRLSNDEIFRKSIDEKKLKEEFEQIISKMELVLMHKKHNSEKRAKLV